MPSFVEPRKTIYSYLTALFHSSFNFITMFLSCALCEKIKLEDDRGFVHECAKQQFAAHNRYFVMDKYCVVTL